MPRTSTSFTPATAPKGKGGSKHRTTQIKEAVGLINFQSLIDFVDGEGAARFLEELKALEGRDFIAAYLKLMEFVKPKPKAENVNPVKELRVGFEREDEEEAITTHTVIFRDYSKRETQEAEDLLP